MRLLVLIAAALLFAGPAQAGLPGSQLAEVGAEPPAGARLELSLAAPGIDGRMRTIGGILSGRPGFLIFADYSCNTLCGTALAQLAVSLADAQLDPARYRILVIGLDPKDSPRAAQAMAERSIPIRLRPSAVFLLPDQPTIERSTTALGFRYAYDAAADQFAHPAAVYLIAPDGTVHGTLSPFALTTVDIRRTLAEATPERSLYERVRLLCYGYDAASGVYTARIAILLRVSAAATALCLGALVLLLIVRMRARTR